MSENKYIIDKDSLTGIADAVRDKLGVGSSIDDKNAGYYPVTGYVLKFNTIQKKIARGETNVIFSISNWDEQFKTWCGKVPEKIKFIRRTAAANPYVSPTTIYCNGVEVIPSDGSSKPVEKIISYPTNGTITVTEYSGSSATTPPAITIEFLDNDENSLGIINGDTGFSYDGQTISFLTGSYNVAIPYSVADIKNNIKDYWNIPKGSLNISANGTYDVTDKASAIVNVSSGGGGGTAERWLVKKLDASRGPWALPTDLNTFEKFSTRIRAIQLNGCLGEVLFKTDGTLCSYKDLNMAAPRVVNNMLSASISEQDIIDAYNDDRLFVVITYKYNNKYQVYMGFKNNQIFFGVNGTSVGLNPGDVVLFYV